MEHLKLLQNTQLDNERLRLEVKWLQSESQAVKEERDKFRIQLAKLRTEFAALQAHSDEVECKAADLKRAQHIEKLTISNLASSSEGGMGVESKTISIPQELIDAFIDHLHDDRKSLGNCGLVCKDWLPSSRSHLFDCLWLDALSGIGPIVGLLDHPLCTFTPFVRRLSINGSTDDCHPKRMFLQSNWLDPIVHHLKHLVSVKVLDIFSIEWPSEFLSDLHSTPVFSAQITELCLYDTWFPSFANVMETVCACSSLVKLEYHCNFGEDESSGDGSYPPKPPSSSLRVLVAEDPSRLNRPTPYSNRNLWDWFIRDQVTTLHTIRLGPVLMEDIVSLGKYLPLLGSSLTHLQFRFHKQEELISSFCRDIDLSKITGLQFLEIGGLFNINTRTNEFSSHVRWVPMILSHFSGALVTELSLNIWCDDWDLYDQDPQGAFNWSPLDTLLMGPKFPRLRKLSFYVWNGSSVITQLVEGMLPRCRARGLLSFNVE